MLTKIQESAKALIAVATPIITVLVVDLLGDLSTKSTGLIAAAATALLVYLTPNKPKPTPPPAG